MRSRRGFTMVEMMAVIVVISILTLLALPSYMERIVREQIEQSLSLAEIAKKPIAAAWAAVQEFPDDNAAALLPVPDKIVNNFVTAVTVDHGAIHLTFGNQANKSIQGKVLTLRPAVVEDAPMVPVAWVCADAAVPGKMTLKGGPDRTNILREYLPIACRGAAKK